MGKLASCRAYYYAERSIQEHGMLIFKPSVIAGAALMLALKAGTPPGEGWPLVLQNITGYTEIDLLPCAIDLYVTVGASTGCRPWARLRRHAFPMTPCV